MKSSQLAAALTELFVNNRTRSLQKQFLRNHPKLTGERRQEFFSLVSRERAAIGALLASTSTDRDAQIVSLLNTLAAEATANTKPQWDVGLDGGPEVEEPDDVVRNVRRVMAEACGWNEAAE